MGLMVWLSEAFVTKGFFAPFLLADILPTSILISPICFPSLFADLVVVVSGNLNFMIFMDDGVHWGIGVTSLLKTEILSSPTPPPLFMKFGGRFN